MAMIGNASSNKPSRKKTSSIERSTSQREIRCYPSVQVSESNVIAALMQ